MMDVYRFTYPFVLAPCLTHDFILDERGHQCRLCGLREEIINGQTWVSDPFMPKDEIRLKEGGVTIGRITELSN